jgi:uncharacterized protein YciI
MLFAWIAYFKPAAEPIPPGVREEASDFLGQPLMKIHSAGQLRQASGEPAGMMIVFEDENREAAERFVTTSPYLHAELYEDHQLYEYGNEVG